MLTPSMESFRPYGPSPLFGSDHEWDATQQALRVTVFGYVRDAAVEGCSLPCVEALESDDEDEASHTVGSPFSGS